MESNQRSVTQARPAAAYMGGKKQLAARLVALIEKTPHDLYAEPFVGMGGVFLRRRKIPRAEVVNDASRDVATFFRVLQRHWPQFMETLRFQITSRAAFERLVATDPSTLTDLERSARFLYLQRLSYGGKVAGRTFGVDKTGAARFNLNTLAPRLEELHERLAGVVIECLDFAAFIQRYDRPGALFYCDPPYVGTEDVYGKELYAPADLERLAAALRGIRGRFILSLNDRPEVRRLFAWARIRAVPVTYTAGSGSGRAKPARELIIRGPRSS